MVAEVAQRITTSYNDESTALTEIVKPWSSTRFEVISLLPEWVELRVPGNLEAVKPLQEFLIRLDADLPQEVSEAINYAFHEMMCNAVEYGCHLDQTAQIHVCFIRLKRAVICRIRDPGSGFNPARLDHSAINNPIDAPLQHAAVRNAKGLRPGGFGILLTRQLVDELVYNERHNELLFVKYLELNNGSERCLA
jgi:anti-sigma regulatory factor (Ser/Thr protein kinase)